MFTCPKDHLRFETKSQFLDHVRTYHDYDDSNYSSLHGRPHDEDEEGSDFALGIALGATALGAFSSSPSESSPAFATDSPSVSDSAPSADFSSGGGDFGGGGSSGDF